MLLQLLCVGYLLRIASSLTIPSDQKLVPANLHQFRDIKVRKATLSDVDDVTHIIIDAFSSDPSYNYQYQYRKSYPEYHFKCNRQTIKQVLEHKSDNVALMVIDVPTHVEGATGDSTMAQYPYGIVAVAGWVLKSSADDIAIASFASIFNSLLPNLNPSPRSATDCSAHLDSNMTRFNSTISQFDAAKHKFIDGPYPSQLYLAVLATHPAWQNRGYAPANLAWGAGHASKMQVPITLIASPMGYPLYVDTGFLSLANITINRVDESEGEPFWLEAMKWDPPASYIRSEQKDDRGEDAVFGNHVGPADMSI